MSNLLIAPSLLSVDFAYDGRFKPTIIGDASNKQVVKIKVGEHQIAMKVIDNKKPENIEGITLKINGSVKRITPTAPQSASTL